MRQPFAAAGTTSRTGAGVALTGDLVHPARLTVPDLLAWRQHEADISFECATSGIQHHRFTGPLLHDVLMGAGPRSDPGRRKDRPRFLIAVSGADGHPISGITAVRVDGGYASWAGHRTLGDMPMAVPVLGPSDSAAPHPASPMRGLRSFLSRGKLRVRAPKSSEAAHAVRPFRSTAR